MADGKVLIVGSSLVRRLNKDINSSLQPMLVNNFGLDLQVDYLCKGGLKLSGLERRLQEIIEMEPDFVFIQCGANDLLDFPYGETVGDITLKLAKKIKTCSTAKQVAIGQNMPRRKGKYIRSIHQEQLYNKNAQRANKYLKVTAPTEDIIYWRHKGLTNPHEGGHGDTLLDDGVHLNPRGQYKLYKSIKGAIVHIRNRHTPSSVQCKDQPQASLWYVLLMFTLYN